ncbi:hypothetical protein [Streptomyces sp. NPDC001165]|uniref:hypothetical protein n=1 Tax=Streptomyces sp. NPDC001165 TaxID=3364546 RepID=UPI00367BDE85
MASRGTNTKSIWAASGLAAVVGVLTGYALFHGSDDGSNAANGDSVPFAGSSTGPKPTSTVPNDWVEPERRAALAQGERTDRCGSQIRFPHTAQGAEAMLAASCTVVVEGSTDTADERLRIYYSYGARDARTKNNAEKVELAANQSDKELQRKFGVAPGSDLPPGAYFRNTVIGFKVIKASDDEVSLWLLSRVTQKAGETAKGRSLTPGTWCGPSGRTATGSCR